MIYIFYKAARIETADELAATCSHAIGCNFYLVSVGHIGDGAICTQGIVGSKLLVGLVRWSEC